MVLTKKKKVDKNNPFQKRKQKVGKQKLKPIAATNAEIHSKTIFLKKQGKEETEEYVNERKLTFSDVCMKLKHFNAGMRKEGLLSLHGMVKVTLEGKATAVPVSSHATLLQSTLPLLIDADREVRKAVAALVKIMAQLLSQHGTLKAMLPLLVRYITVALTHMDSPVRATACKSLHHICQTTTSPLPDGPTLLECTHRMFRSAERPRDRTQSPTMQAYISILHSSLSTASSTGYDFLSSVTPSDDTATTDLTTERGVATYLATQGIEAVLPHWVEALQDHNKDTKVGAWELGLLDILNTLFTALAYRQGPKAAGLSRRYLQLPKTFKQSIGRIAGSFPLNTTTSEGHRVNTQLALLITCFFPLNADTVHKWVTKFLKGNAARVLRPQDIQALCVVVERVNKYSPAELLESSNEVSLTDLLKVCGTPGSPSQLEIVKAVRRMVDESVARARPFASGMESCVKVIPSMLYELMSKMNSTGVAGPGTEHGLSLVPTVDGGVLEEAGGATDMYQQAAHELLSLLLRYSLSADLPSDCLMELQLSLFASFVENTWHPGLLRFLPPQLAYICLSFLPALAPTNELSLLNSVLADLDTQTPQPTDKLLAYALSLLQPHDLSECYEQLQHIQTLEGFVLSQQIAAEILAEYSIEE